MPASGIEHPPFLPGQYMAARATLATTEANLIGAEWEGKEFWFLDYDWSATGARTLRSAIPRKLRIVRNVLGVSIPPKRCVVLGIDGAANDSTSTYGTGSTYTAIQTTVGPGAFTRVGGVARLPTMNAYPVDEFLVSTGVPHGALFYIVIEGPAVVKTDLVGADIAAGDWLGGVVTATTAAATNGNTGGGRITTATAVASTDTPPNGGIFNLLGRAISSTTAADSDCLIHVKKVF